MVSARLIFFCGKMAAGKSTLSRELEPPGDDEGFVVTRHSRP